MKNPNYAMKSLSEKTIELKGPRLDDLRSQFSQAPLIFYKLSLLTLAVSLAGCAATSPNYKAPNVKGDVPAIVISGTRAVTGSACLSTIVVDGVVAGTVGPQETLVIPTKPGQYFVRWDLGGGGLCPLKEDLAHRLVVVKDGPVLLKLDVSGMGKAFIPIVGMFTRPEHRILAVGEE